MTSMPIGVLGAPPPYPFSANRDSADAPPPYPLPIIAPVFSAPPRYPLSVSALSADAPPPYPFTVAADVFLASPPSLPAPAGTHGDHSQDAPPTSAGIYAGIDSLDADGVRILSYLHQLGFSVSRAFEYAKGMADAGLNAPEALILAMDEGELESDLKECGVVDADDRETIIGDSSHGFERLRKR